MANLANNATAVRYAKKIALSVKMDLLAQENLLVSYVFPTLLNSYVLFLPPEIVCQKMEVNRSLAIMVNIALRRNPPPSV